MTEQEKIRAAFAPLHASSDTIEEVLKMTDYTPKSTHSFRKPLLAAAIACLLVALSVGAYAAAGHSIFGWGGNLEVKQDENGDTQSILYTESLTEPVEIQDGRMYFIVNDERIDITDSVSETQPYEYSYIDEENVTHYWMIGLNGPELEHYGYGEFLQNADGEWLGGYVARTNMESDGSYPTWVSIGKEEIHAPEN